MHIGDIATLDVFGPYVDDDKLIARIPKNLNVIGEEMEAFALFHVARQFNREAACILTAVDSKFTNYVVSSEERQCSLNEMITLALEAIIQ